MARLEERRKQTRFAASLEPVVVSFSGDARGVGKLYDVSDGGCKIESSDTPTLGATLTLELKVSDQRPPLVIDSGIVGWTIKNKYFGVKFLDVAPTHQLALKQYLASLGV